MEGTGGREPGRTGGGRGREAGEQGAGSGSRSKEGYTKFVVYYWVLFSQIPSIRLRHTTNIQKT